MRLILLLSIWMLISSACVGRVASVAVDIENEVQVDPFRERAKKIVSSLSDNLLAAQPLISGIDGRDHLTENMAQMLGDFPTGGVMLFRYNLTTDPDSTRAFLSQVTTHITEHSGIPPFIAVDHEGGTVNRFNRGFATLPDASSYWNVYQTEGLDGALELIEADSYRAAKAVSSLGINMNFAPVAEHLIDANRTFLARRSYGVDPVFTGKAATAFIRGMQREGIICVVKHFPGSAGADPHYALSILDVGANETDTLASPFAYAINNGARAIMAAHTSVPVIDTQIASLSQAVMGNWLRGRLGFDGIIISDDFIMAAANQPSPYTAAVRSIAAGSDMILVWPAHIKQTHDAILAGLQDGSLPRERLVNAAQRIVYEKLRLGMF